MLNNFILLLPEIYISFIILTILTFLSFSKDNIYNNFNILIFTIISLLINILIIFKFMFFNLNFFLLNEILNVNNIQNFSKLFLVILSIFILINSFNSIKNKEILSNEYSLILLTSLLGMFIIISGNDLLLIYLGIELYSLPLYVLASIKRWSQKGTEAALKYFVIGSLASGIYLFSTSIIYLLTGTLKLNELYIIFNSLNEVNIFLFSFILIICSILIKIAAAPFHMWAPDVYDGAPLIITNFFATLPKLSSIILLNNIFIPMMIQINYELKSFLIFISIFSIIIGAIGGLNQNKLKRLLAFSSISRVGFILLSISNLNLAGFQYAYIYLIFYTVGTIGLFSLSLMFIKDDDYLYNFKGFSKYNKWGALIFSTLLFSTAGIPPLAGFIIKYLVIIESIKENNWVFALIALIASIISLIYYIRIVKIFYFKNTVNFNNKLFLDILKIKDSSSFSLSIITGLSLYFTITFIIYPNFFIKLINYLLMLNIV